MAEEKVEEVKVEAAEAAEVKVEAKEEVKAADKKKAPRKGGKRPFNKKGGKFGGKPAAPKAPKVFSDSLEDRFPALAAKLKKQIEDGIKQKIKDAQKDPKVAEASKKFADK
ncbi:hypothetical protein SAMN05720766_105162 [Fibrobacter sp. UWH9]|uniref:hypothetical protein n=1 Tax=unclassified Fibrobacter TaxID=2634177 RepID=UPI000916AE98|nr:MULTISPECIES: hypothetical protein [Fibrobacter]MCQ2099017.1 hypothetical protein [Fibrobacter sp.]MCL4100822.1 hypothetical protein [Fibrobacter succinogenes]OWV15379.1 hypothetical protein B7992_04835 [Fibrobacter sp. UWH1]SHG95315.1 hypothetical protein SAMN05720766_105162 [Fibrobacter sp. UWH9]SHL09200.1 hypothetical protein SAMN05720764_107127 [Fibrobacter sp. UWH5]